MLQKTQHGIYTSSAFTKFPELICAISTREFGNLKFAKRGNKFLISSNFQKFTDKLASDFSFIQFEQVHRAKIVKVKNQLGGSILRSFDGGATTEEKLFLAIFVADCFPILAYDPLKKIVGAAHAGWRGVKSQIAQNLIVQLRSLGSEPRNLIVGVGPGICGNCYEVGEDVAFQFNQRFLVKKNERILLDLEKAIIEQLIQLGIKKKNIDRAGVCVFEDTHFFSTRREGETGRMAAVIGIR